MKILKNITTIICLLSGACFVAQLIWAQHIAKIVTDAPARTYEGASGFVLNLPLMMLFYAGSLVAAVGIILLIVSSCNTQQPFRSLALIISHVALLPVLLTLVLISMRTGHSFLAVLLSVLLPLVVLGLPFLFRTLAARRNRSRQNLKTWQRILSGIIWVTFSYLAVSSLLGAMMFLTICFPGFDLEKHLKAVSVIMLIPGYGIPLLMAYCAWKGLLPGTRKAEQ